MKKLNSCDSSELKKKVFIVDDHPIVREGLAMVINREKDLTTCGEAEDLNEAIKGIKKTKPNVVTVDLSLGLASGLDIIKDIGKTVPGLPILVISMLEESVYAERALRAGAMGYIMKHEATKRVINGIRSVLAGEIYFSDEVANNILHKFVGLKKNVNCTPLDRLSDRELEVFKMIGNGLGTRKIAESMHVSVKTIETYQFRIKEKLGLMGANELTHTAIQWVLNDKDK